MSNHCRESETTCKRTRFLMGNSTQRLNNKAESGSWNVSPDELLSISNLSGFTEVLVLNRREKHTVRSGQTRNSISMQRKAVMKLPNVIIFLSLCLVFEFVQEVTDLDIFGSQSKNCQFLFTKLKRNSLHSHDRIRVNSFLVAEKVIIEKNGFWRFNVLLCTMYA